MREFRATGRLRTSRPGYGARRNGNDTRGAHSRNQEHLGLPDRAHGWGRICSGSAMPLKDDHWVTEVFNDRTAFSVRSAGKLFEEVSQFQTIEIFQTDVMGRALLLNG